VAIGSDDADFFSSIDQAACIMEQVLVTERFMNSLNL
jgi:hypothetical protein